MRSHLANESLRTQDLVLVLGVNFVSSQIADELRVEGFNTLLERDLGMELCTPETQGSIQILRKFLGHFSSKAMKPVQLWIHPGVSPWLERQELYSIAKELGIMIFGPSPKVVSLFSSRLNFLSLADELKIPHLVMSFDPIVSAREVIALVDSIEASKGISPYPVVLKSIRGGGGGPGFFVLHGLEELDGRFQLWSDQINQNVGESIFFVENYLEDSRRILVPFVRFSSGETIIFPKAECSLQYRHREILTFCPAFGLDSKMETQLCDWTKTFVNECQYVGIGVLEYLVDGTRAYLIDGKPGLNSNYVVWEAASQYSIVSWQLATFSHEKSPFQEEVNSEEKITISAQIYAENPFLEIPQPGLIHSLSLPKPYQGIKEWAKVNARFQSGESVDLKSNGLVAHVLAQAKTRDRAIELVRDILNQTWISGSLQTNERFVLELLDHPWVKEGIFHSSFVEEEFIPLWDPPEEILGIFAWICFQVGRFIGRPHHEGMFQVGNKRILIKGLNFEWIDQPEFWKKGILAGANAEVQLNADRLRVCAYPLGTGDWQVRVGAWWSLVREIHSEQDHVHELLAQTSGNIYSRLYREGSIVKAHEPLLLIYSLRTLVPHALPIAVKIKKWHAQPESKVRVGQKILDWTEVTD